MRRPASTAQLELPLAAEPTPAPVTPRLAHACPACGWFREGFAPCPACGDGPVLRLPPRRRVRPEPP
ncbi:hypothetical protein [Nannocystis sp.]|uniref:hypothetical protein n=1 Tax=Nannocystis sp. TaxID=1962667 RepID=UPI002427E088|nr:hypothetical protein [Nannocystis sp.]MBK7826031.1 hypothetical protein [Nannocystis sp.]MBK9755435.1 hypothetical protein [Nannocystis sp.]